MKTHLIANETAVKRIREMAESILQLTAHDSNWEEDPAETFSLVADDARRISKLANDRADEIAIEEDGAK